MYFLETPISLFFWTKDLMIGTTARHQKTSEKVSHSASGWIIAELSGGLKMGDEPLHSSQIRSESVCFPDLRACLISERESGKETQRIREKQTRKRWVGGKEKNIFWASSVQNCCKLETDCRRWMAVCVGGESNGHSNPSDRKYCYQAASYLLLSLVSRIERSTQIILQQKRLHYGGFLTGIEYLGRLWSPHHHKFGRNG